MKKFTNLLLSCLVGTMAFASIASAKEAKSHADVPNLRMAWNNELHTGNMHLNFIKPELFANNAIHMKPISKTHLELYKNGELIAVLEHVFTRGGSESAQLMTQGHLDIAFGSSTAFLAAYDNNVDLKILAPVQSGGVSIVAKADAPYNTFEELVEYAKNSKMPVLGGYHSAVSSPRVVLEYALKDAGLKVTEDASNYDADVLLTDLKGLKNLIPSMAAGQVEIWAGPVPHPQNAESQGVGKIIATLDQLPGGKWIDFPCCSMNVRGDVMEKYPEIVEAVLQVATDVSNFAQNNREEAAELLSEFIGLSKEVLIKNDTTYSTEVTDKFVNGMETYYNVMKDMGKFNGRLTKESFDEVLKNAFDFTYSNKITTNS
ncbi:MAG: ABC transporter substrate-binding protein [Campylobacteraceae bacterium]|nr:ABC transporter substrate-binding protein [Campylobacteraceae bacterium]